MAVSEDGGAHLVQLERHSYSGNHHFPEQLHVCEDPFVSDGGDAEVSLEQRMEPVEEGLQVAEMENYSQSSQGL